MTLHRDAPSAEHGSVAPAKSNNTWYKWEWAWVAGLLALTILLRLAFLDRVPPGVRFDELVNVKMADHIYAGEWPIYFQEAWGHEPLYHYFQAGGMSLLGKTVLGVRIASILFGVLGVLTTYLLFRRLFDVGVALVTATLLSTSLWSLMYSRVGLRHISLPPWVGLCAYCFWRGLEMPTLRRARGTLWFALGGLCMGVMLYTYFASRVVPVIWVAFTLYLVLFHRPTLRGRWMGLILFFLLPMLIVTPMALYLRQHPELEQRLGQVGSEIFAALRAGTPSVLPSADSLGAGVLGTLKMFSLQGDPEWLYNISRRPIFDPLTAILFFGGVLVSLWHWHDPRQAFILLWLVVGITPAMLSWPPGSLGHTIAAQPVTFAFPALFLVALWQRTCPEPRPERAQVPLGRRKGSRRARQSWWIRRGAHALSGVAILAFVSINGYDYFVRWPKFPEVRHEYQAPVTAVARYLRKHGEAESACVSAPYVDYWNPWSKRNFDLYFQDHGDTVRWFNGANSILFPAHEEALFFLPDHILSPSELDADLHALLMSGSRPTEIAYRDLSGSTFDVYRWEDRAALEQRLRSAASAQAWISPEGPLVPGESERQRRELSFPLDFGHRLSLLGYTYGQTQIVRGTTWRAVTYWRVLDANSDPLAIFVHVLDNGNTVAAGWDGLQVSTESWRQGDVFIHVHMLDVPDDIPVGAQRVEVGVYSPVTLERLALFVGQANETAPYNRALLKALDIQ